jgi:hypothetical protein
VHDTQLPSLLRDPIEHACALYEERRAELEARGWSLADVYRNLGGGTVRSSELHDEFSGFFNGQARSVLVPGDDGSKLAYWAGIPERGATLRDKALEILAGGDVDAARAEPGALPADPETRSLILAHNQIDAELYAHFLGIAERGRTRPRARRSGPRTLQHGDAVCVLGPPRSGTSLTARILNILGVDLGPEDELMEAAADNNRTGFWEHEGIANLNEEIFASLSDSPPPYLQGWRWPPPLTEGWEQDPLLEPHRRAARSLLHGLAGGPLWGWKDPRTSLTLPFWQQLVPEMRYVICVRHPLGVAASLATRDEMSLEESVRLWLRYTSQAVLHTSERPRVFVSYEGFFPDWKAQTKRLASFLGKPEIDANRRAAIADHLDDRLWHHREPEQTAESAEAGLLSEACAFHGTLSTWCGPDTEPGPDAEAGLRMAARRVSELLAQA